MSGSFSNLRKFLHIPVLNILSKRHEWGLLQVFSALCFSKQLFFRWYSALWTLPTGPELPTLSSPLQDFSGLCLGFLSQYCSLEIHSRKITGAMIGFISFASPLSGITILHCLQLMSENHCFLYLPQFIHWVRNKEGKSRDLLLQFGLKHMLLLIYDVTKFSRMLEGSKEGIIGWCMDLPVSYLL